MAENCRLYGTVKQFPAPSENWNNKPAGSLPAFVQTTEAKWTVQARTRQLLCHAAICKRKMGNLAYLASGLSAVSEAAGMDFDSVSVSGLSKKDPPINFLRSKSHFMTFSHKKVCNSGEPEPPQKN